MTLAVRLLLAPAFVVGTSLLARRFGPLVGGMVGGLPVVGGPVLLVLTLEHGTAFGADSSRATLTGLLALTTFVLVYARACRRWSPVPCVLLGWAGFFAVDLALADLTPPSVVMLVAGWLWCSAALRLLPPVPQQAEGTALHTRWDLPVRAVAAAAMVVTIAALSDQLGARWSGLLAPFPIVATVLAAFTHAQMGPVATSLVLRGLLLGYFAYGLFAFVLAIGLEPLATAGAFLAATASALALQVPVMELTRRRRATTAPTVERAA